MRRNDHLCIRLLDWSFTSGEDCSTFHDLAVDVGVNAFRIGLEWPRILPGETFAEGTSDPRSIATMDAVEHYKRTMLCCRQER